MTINHGALERKRKALESIARTSVPGLGAADASQTVSAFARLTAPESEGGGISVGYITVMSTFNPRATTRKPGNIVLNWKKLIDLVPDVALAGIGAAAAPAWVLTLAGLYIWNKLWRGSEEQLTDHEASSILALWKNRNHDDQVSEEIGFFKTNELRIANGRSPLSSSEYATAIGRLVELECIEVENGIVWLREWVRVKY